MISPAQYGLQRYLRHTAQWVWREQDDARHFGFKLQEETITEMLLLRMARDWQAKGLNVKMFNRLEEGGNKKTGKIGNGADWEWFVKTRHCQVGFRVQAKVLSSGVTTAKKGLSIGKYDGLLANKKQTNELINAAKVSRYNPIYVFYNHPWVSDRALFSARYHHTSVNPGEWGCAVATANYILASANNNLSTLIHGMVPWHRFFGLGRSCLTSAAMAQLGGDQAFIEDCPPPAWLYYFNDGEKALDEYLLEHRLKGVAYFDFSEVAGD